MSAFRVTIPAPVERLALAGAVGLLAAAAWVVLWSADSSVHGILHFHGRAGLVAPLQPSTVLAFVAAWTGMSIAMMLPTCLPVLATLHTFASDRSDRSLLIALAAFGYLAAWTAVGVIAGPISLGMQNAVTVPDQMRLLDRVAGPALLLVAGLFQFSALKYRCLEKCRSPLQMVLSHWSGRSQRAQAFRLGWASGVYCVGCCWALMLLMFLSSVGHLAWMLVLGLVMAVEKNVRWGRRLSAPVGTVLIAGAVVVFLAGGELGVFSRLAMELCGTK